MRVLIADISPLLSERLAGLLSELDGLQIIGRVRNAQEALSAIRELKPDVVLIDVHLLGKAGLDLLKTLKRKGDAPFVMMLAHDVSDPYQKQCLESGADLLLYKTADLGKVFSILKNLLHRHHSAAEPQEFPQGE
jgi:DNA-binding NarL/FixJ family response regulator